MATTRAALTPGVARPDISAATPLQRVVVPGAVGSASTPGSRGNPDIAAEPRAPAFREESDASRGCAAHQLDALTSLRFLDRAGLEASYADSLEVAKRRHAQNFDQQHFRNQRRVVDGYLARIDPSRLQRLQAEEEQYRARLNQRREDAARGMRHPLPGAPIARTPAHLVPAADEALKTNEQILNLREQEISRLELQLGDRFLTHATKAMTAFVQTPPSQAELAQLRDTETLLVRHLLPCLNARARLSDAGKQLLDADISTYREHALKVANTHVALLLRVASEAQSLQQFEGGMESLVGSRDMSQLILRRSNAAPQLSTRLGALLAKDAADRAAAAADAEATWNGTVPAYERVQQARKHTWLPKGLVPTALWRPYAGSFMQAGFSDASFDDRFDGLAKPFKLEVQKGQLEMVQLECVGGGVHGLKVVTTSGQVSKGQVDSYGNGAIMGRVAYTLVGGGSAAEDAVARYADIFSARGAQPLFYIIRSEDKDRLFERFGIAKLAIDLSEKWRAGISADPARYFPTIELRQLIRGGGLAITLTPKDRSPVTYRLSGEVVTAFANFCSGRAGALDVRDAAIQEELRLRRQLSEVKRLAPPNPVLDALNPMPPQTRTRKNHE